MTKIIGLTGGIATGKSTAADFFKQQQIPVIDADTGAREVVAPGTQGLKKIAALFGNEMIQPDGSLDRSKLGALIFSDEEARKKLNEILRSDIRNWIENQIRLYSLENPNLIIVDIPLLFEAHYEDMMDEVLVIALDVERQKERLMKRNHLTEQEAEQRIRAQWPMEEKIKRADVVIFNQHTVEDLHRKLEEWLSSINQKDTTE